MIRRRLILALLLAGCHGAPHADNAGGALPTQPLRIISAEYAYGDFPDTLAAGPQVIRLVNQGREPHLIDLARLDSGHTTSQLLAVVRAGGYPGWAVDMGGPNAVFPGDSATAAVFLNPGHYAVLCWVPDSSGVFHLLKGMVHNVIVTDSRAAAAEPVADDTVRMANYRLNFSHPLTTGMHIIQAANVDSTAEHDLLFIRLHPSSSPDSALAWLDSLKGSAMSFDVVSGLSGITRGQRAYVYVDLTPGRYIVMCLMPDAKDGRGHFRHGMMESFTIPN